MNPFRYTLQIATNKLMIVRLRFSIYEAVMYMGYSEEYAERVANGTMIHNEGDTHTFTETKAIQTYYDEIDRLQKANKELGQNKQH
jgi:predicted GIY-YIG superfamily endonuclease